MGKLWKKPNFSHGRRGLSLAKKLIYSFAALNAVLIVLGGIGVLNLRMTQQMSRSIVTDRLMPFESLTQVQDQLRNIQLDLYETELSNSLTQQYNYQGQIQAMESKINKNLATLSTGGIQKADGRQWEAFSTDLGDSTVAIANDFNNLTSTSTRTLTSTRDVSQTISDLDKLITFETNAANKTVRRSHRVYIRALWTSLAVVLSALLLSILLAIFTLRATLRPVRIITMEMKKIAQNSGDLTKRLAFRSRDEVGQLASSFNEMINSIQNIIKTISRSTEQMAGTSQELSAMSGEVMNISVQIAHRTQDISSGAHEQKTAIKEAMTMVTNMNEHIQRLRTNAEQVSMSSDVAQSSVESGHHAVEETSRRITAVSTSFNKLNKQIYRLGGQVEKINTIVEFITGIADQSNLLSLNASVEAARAGDGGRSFAVVADEMRKMSRRSKDAALEIQKISQHIQAEMGSVSTQMQRSNEAMELGLQTIDRSASSFDEIEIHVAHVHQQIEESLCQIVELANGTAGLNQSVERVLKIAEGFAHSTEEVAAATEEQSATMQETVSAIEHVTRQAESLTVLIGQFTY